MSFVPPPWLPLADLGPSAEEGGNPSEVGELQIWDYP